MGEANRSPRTPPELAPDIPPEMPPRNWREVFRDDAGQLVTEWALVTATVVIPIGLLLPGAMNMMRIYFYRIAGTIVLPFP